MEHKPVQSGGTRRAEGPYFEDLAAGQVYDSAPSVTLTSGLAAVHQSIVGDRLRLPLDATLAESVLGAGPAASPSLVWDLAIGQSTLVTHHVRANLFYRGLVLRRLPVLGDTLTTAVAVEALKQNRQRLDGQGTGLAALRVTTRDQHGRTVLDFWRCAMILMRDAEVQTGHRDALESIGTAVGDSAIEMATAGWSIPESGGRDLVAGSTVRIVGGDVVSSAPELARLTLNIASVHHDAPSVGGRRLVYGGHTIGLALSQATRAIPELLSVVAWHACDHLAPVHEGDLLRSVITVESVEQRRGGGRVLHLRSRMSAVSGADDDMTTPVLDWRFVAVSA